ncbi:MAG: hypothetical protein ACLFSJ_02925, partial [Halorhodospira sp.]
MDEQITLESIADGIRKRLGKPDPDYHGITSELQGAQLMALALGDEQAAEQVRQLQREASNAWAAALSELGVGSAAEDDRPDAAGPELEKIEALPPDAAIQAAIAAYGPEVVHQAAQAHLEGDSAALQSLGIKPATAGDCWRALSMAHDAMDEEQRQRVEARNDAALEAQAGGLPVAVVAASESGLKEVEALPPAATLASAKAAAAARGYRVIDVGEGGQCET